MLTQEDKIRLIHEFRTALLNRMFDELCRKAPSSSTEQVSVDIVAVAKCARNQPAIMPSGRAFRSRPKGRDCHRPIETASCRRMPNQATLILSLQEH